MSPANALAKLQGNYIRVCGAAANNQSLPCQLQRSSARSHSQACRSPPDVHGERERIVSYKCRSERAKHAKPCSQPRKIGVRFSGVLGRGCARTGYDPAGAVAGPPRGDASNPDGREEKGTLSRSTGANEKRAIAPLFADELTHARDTRSQRNSVPRIPKRSDSRDGSGGPRAEAKATSDPQPPGRRSWGDLRSS